MSGNSGNEPIGEGGTRVGFPRLSWAERLGSSLPATLNKNILEVVLEKDTRGAFFVKEEECARMMKKIGLDPHPGVQVDGVKICPSGRGAILITLRDHVKIEEYCRYDVLVITESGIRSTMMKPAGKKEVVITLRGIHPNTRDSIVLDYLSKFGKVVTTKVVHGVFADGPLKGMKNGNRSYKIEVTPGKNIGSYHYIDGQKVSLGYPGQLQTCSRCHQTSNICRGNGIAKKCESEGGIRTEFTDYILNLWQSIGYSPPSGGLPEDCEEGADDAAQGGESFTPAKAVVRDEEKYAGVSIRQLPKEVDHGEVMEFLCAQGLPDEKKDEVIITPNGVVTIHNLDNKLSNTLVKPIHGQLCFGKKLYCNGIIPLTPGKTPQLAEKKGRQDTLASSTCPPSGSLEADPSMSAASLPSNAGPNSSSEAPAPALQDQVSPPTTSPSRESGSILTESATFLTKILDQPSNESFLRRHSLSLTNRTPPRNSIASEILGNNSPSLLRTRSMLNELRGITEQLSEFGSCLSSTGNSSGSEAFQKELKKVDIRI